MVTSIKNLRLYVRLDEELSRRFSQIQEYLGLKNSSEVMRMLINDFWRKHREELSKNFWKEGGPEPCLRVRES
jgi:hypothetical protein